MSHHEATFEIESQADARVARLLAERAYDTLREELREIDRGDTSQKETLQQSESIREATRSRSAGTLTTVYESRDGAIE